MDVLKKLRPLGRAEPPRPDERCTESGSPGHRTDVTADRFTVPQDAESTPAVGHQPENRRQMTVKLLWITIWMFYLGAPVSDLFGGGHTALTITLGGLSLIAYIVVYLLLIVRPRSALFVPLPVYGALAALLLLAVSLSLTLGSQWLVLFVYLAVSAGATLPTRQARWAISMSVAVLIALGMLTDADYDMWPALVIPSLLGGMAMTGVRQMVRTTRELREARATVAHLAASDERLRLARDLHDLLGHSLSLITLKSELAGRMLPGEPEAAAEQVADIERVSRQALVDVREAVSDYRRPTLDVELASAGTALAAAGITARLPRPVLPPGLHPDQHSAMAWALREACTNVVRHSGAERCTVTLTEQADDTLCLTVTDNGHGPDGPHGNGLTGLAERLALADGTLETGAGVRGGFQLRATVPVRAVLAGEERHVTLPT